MKPIAMFLFIVSMMMFAGLRTVNVQIPAAIATFKKQVPADTLTKAENIIINVLPARRDAAAAKDDINVARTARQDAEVKSLKAQVKFLKVQLKMASGMVNAILQHPVTEFGEHNDYAGADPCPSTIVVDHYYRKGWFSKKLTEIPKP